MEGWRARGDMGASCVLERSNLYDAPCMAHIFVHASGLSRLIRTLQYVDVKP
jgi:hypothetical protein